MSDIAEDFFEEVSLGDGLRPSLAIVSQISDITEEFLGKKKELMKCLCDSVREQWMLTAVARVKVCRYQACPR